MKTQTRIILALSLIALAAVILLTGIARPGQSRYSRIGNDDSFHVEFHPLNTLLSESYPLSQGDAVEITVNCDAGALHVCVGLPGETPLCESDGTICDAFTVNIPADGDYLLEVSGKRAVGSVDFQIRRAEGSAS